jgi:hypothetical protein
VDESPLQKRAQREPGHAPAWETREHELRASDADRDRVADILRDAMAEGRLTSDEHSERLEAVYAAKTVGELEPLVRDLPGGRPPSAPAAAPQGSRTSRAGAWTPDPTADTPSLVGILGGTERRGRWRVGDRITAVAFMGGVVIDLTEATFTAPEVVINVTTVMGGVEIVVPENVTLIGSVTGILGGSDIRAHESPDPRAPVVRVRGVAFMGGVEAKPKRGKRLRPREPRVTLDKPAPDD